MLIEPGTYGAKVTAATVKEYDTGSVMCRIRVDINGSQITGGICLIQKDGTLSERGFSDVKMLFGWNGTDWDFWAKPPEEHAGPDVDVVIETKTGDEGEYSSIKYINVPGSGGGAKLEAADAKSLAANYGAKTRALFGGAPAAKSPPKAPGKKPGPPAAKKVDPSTMEACWDKFVEKHAGKSETELYEIWPKNIHAATGKEQNDCTPEDWGKFMAVLVMPF